MNILITGSTGLIGSKIIELCVKKGFSVKYLTTRKSKIINSDLVEGFLWDPSTRYINKNCFKNVDTIVNLAGSSISKRWTNSHKKSIIGSRLNSLRFLKESIINNNVKIKHLVSASAIGIYKSSKTKIYNENDDVNHDNFLSDIVLKWEKEANHFKKLGIKVSIIRIGLVLSKLNGIFPKSIMPIKFGLGSYFGTGDQWQSWIHINDISNIFLFIIQEKLYGVFNAVAPNPVTNKVFVNTIAKQINRPIFLPGISKTIMSLILGEMHIIVFESQRVDSKKIVKKKFQFQFKNFDDAVKDLVL